MPVPKEILTQHVAVLGKTRSGKSSVMRGLVEDLLEREQPVCIVDPKGDWWGIKLAADGKGPGFPVVIFGGEHADIPINEHAGAHVAELFATGNRPCLIDLGGWTVGARTRFWVEFASTLFKHTRGSRWLAVDEIHNFAPKGKVFDAEAGKALHWTNRLASEGLGKGVSMIFASQRPQKVHNDTLTSAETLIAMRVLHPSDRGAVAEWIKGCGDSEGSEVLNSLAQMDRGEGWAWSPEIGFGPKRVKFPMFRTYDSFRPQTVEDARKLKGWAEVNLNEVREKLAATIEKAKADDPRELRRRIQELERQVSGAAIRALAASATETRIEVPIVLEKDLAQAERLMKHAEELVKRSRAVTSAMTEIHSDLHTLYVRIDAAVSASQAGRDRSPGRVAQVRTRSVVLAPVAPRVLASGGNGAIGNSGLRRILVALAQRNGLTRRQLGVRAMLSSRSGTFDTYLSKGNNIHDVVSWPGQAGAIVGELLLWLVPIVALVLLALTVVVVARFQDVRQIVAAPHGAPFWSVEPAKTDAMPSIELVDVVHIPQHIKFDAQAVAAERGKSPGLGGVPLCLFDDVWWQSCIGGDEESITFREVSTALNYKRVVVWGCLGKDVCGGYLNQVTGNCCWCVAHVLDADGDMEIRKLFGLGSTLGLDLVNNESRRHLDIGTFNPLIGCKRGIKGSLLLRDNLQLPVANALLSQRNGGLLARDVGLSSVRLQLKESNDEQSDGSSGDNPVRRINRRGWILVLSVLAWGGCLWLGFRRIDRYGNRESAGYCYFGLGFGVLVGGFLLFLLSDFRSTWSWWL